MDKILSVLLLVLCIFSTCLMDRFAKNLEGDGSDARCSLKPEQGMCRAYIPKYYFDDGCKEFVWGGCKGSVPFHSLEDCLSVCSNKK